MPDPLDLSRAPRIADMINAWFCPQCGLRDETMRGIDQDGTCSSCGSDCCTWDSVRGHLAHYGWEVVSADDGIAALTAELEQSKADFDSVAELKAIAEAEFARLREYAAGCEKTAVLNQMENVQLKLDLATERAAREKAEAGLLSEKEGKAVLIQDLATERAAREKAEKQLADAEDKLTGCAESLETWQNMHADSESERDTALALSTERYQELCRQAQRATDAETALASAQHRIAELEAYGNDCCARAVSGAVGNHLHRIAQLESALASARELLVRVQAWHAWPDPTEPGPEPGVCLLNAVDAWLASHLAPAAAPCAPVAPVSDSLCPHCDRVHSPLCWTAEDAALARKNAPEVLRRLRMGLKP